jgi:hypothetical protein
MPPIKIANPAITAVMGFIRSFIVIHSLDSFEINGT